MKISVGSVSVNPAGLRDVLKSAEVASALDEKCKERASEMESEASAYAHSPHSSLFVTKVKTLDNAAVGFVFSKGGTGQAGRGKSARKIDLAQAINNKHNIIHW